jgi:diguanylate cyclase (GGDEF)-like protein/PAS domain S-box-containing protein
MSRTPLRQLLVTARLAFADPAVETDFLTSYAQNSRSQAQVALFLALLMGLVFLPQDTVIAPVEGEKASLVRLFVFAPLMLTCLALTFWRRFDAFRQVYLSVASFGGVLCFLAILVFLDNEQGHGLSSSMGLSNVTLAIIYVFAVSTIRFLAAALVALLLVVAYYIAATRFTEVDHSYFINGDFSNALFIMVIGCFIGLSRELYIRRNFFLQLRLEERFRDLVEGSIQGVLIHRSFKPIFVNQAYARIFGFEDPSQVLEMPSVLPLYDEGERKRIKDFDEDALAGRAAPAHYEYRGRHLDGRAIWLDNVSRVVSWQGDQAVQCTIVEITERKRVEEDLRKLGQAVEQSPASVMITDIEGCIEYVNPKFVELTGYSIDEVKGKTPDFIRSGYTADKVYRAQRLALQAGREWRGEQHSRKKNGEFYWEYVLVSPIVGADGETRHFLAVSEDITLRKEYEDKLVHQANFDDLTQLPNRVLLMDRLARAIKSAKRTGRHVALMLVDLDRFKNINDTLGHAAGDQLLCEAASRLEDCMREGDTVARLGGDEFAAVLSDLAAPHDVEAVATRMLDALGRHFEIANQELFCSASIGATMCPEDGDDPQILMRNADAAMYRVKETGRNGFEFFTPEMNAEAQTRNTIESHLRRAQERDELDLYYQPLVDLHTGRIIGAEALLRWLSGPLGEVAPAEFVPIAEDTGLIVPIGKWVIENACRQAAIWRSNGTGPNYVAVNISIRQFRGGDLVGLVQRALEAAELPPDALELEVTESLLLANNPEAEQSLNELSELGIRLSIDDFGTGYSSLSYLKRYPFSTIKIDHSFVRDVAGDREDKALIEAIVAMGHSLSLTVVAEGVETDQQVEFLRSRGCDVIQGYLVSEPLCAEDFDDLMRNRSQAIERRSVQNIPAVPRRRAPRHTFGG